ncbi:MAG: ATP-grasp fold amidoligase family protein [bacterium]
MSLLRFPSRRKMRRIVREAIIDTPVRAAKITRTMLSQHCSWKIAAELAVASKALGYMPKLQNPRSLNEKILYRKLFAPPANAHVLADKLAVRDHVERLVGGQYLVPLLAVYKSADEIDLAQLPKSFIIKANHACGRNLIVTDRDAVDPERLRRECRAFLATEFGRTSNERWYCDIPRRLVVEELLIEEGLPAPLDYKFFVFDGKPELVQVDHDRYGTHIRSLYTTSWEKLDITYRLPQGPTIDRPAMLDEMLEVARRLAEDIDFVRIDLYSLPKIGRIYFGECTLTPIAGWGRFGPTKDVDFRLGALWRLERGTPRR